MSILASTVIKHPEVSHKIPVYVLDAQAALGDQIAAEPPAQPFDHASPPLPEQGADAQPNKKRRKREPKLDRAQIEEREHHTRVKPWLKACAEAAQRVMSDRQWTNYVTNNVTAAASATDQEANLVSWSTHTAHIQPPLDLLSLDGNAPLTPADLARRLVLNPHDSSRQLQVQDDKPPGPGALSFKIPPRGSFCLSPLQDWPDTLSELENVDLVILDPPWPNKSVSRSDSYDAIDIYDLFDIQLPSILHRSPSTLVAVWVTNKPKFRRFVVDKLFRDWGIDLQGEWYWIKTDTSGRPLFSFENEHRRCYEGLILGRWGAESSGAPVASNGAFMSTLLGHSRKPYILNLLKPFFPKDGSLKVLELFSRCIPDPSAGVDNTRRADEGERQSVSWVSAGLEAVKFNQLGIWSKFHAHEGLDD